MTSLTARATDPSVHGCSASATTVPEATDRSPAAPARGRTVRSWPLLILAVPAAAEVWSGWVGIAQKTGFGLVSPLPGILPSLHLDTAITLPVGVEAYAAYALRAWLSSGNGVSARTRRFAKWSAIFSFALGMAGQVAYHLLAQAGMARAPWAITTIVSCLPVLVLAMGTTLAHMLHADMAAVGVALRGARRTSASQGHPSCDPVERRASQRAVVSDAADSNPPSNREGCRSTETSSVDQATPRVRRTAQPESAQIRLIALSLAAAGQPVSRRALRTAGAKGSNETLNALARELKAVTAIQSDGLCHATHPGATGVTGTRPEPGTQTTACSGDPDRSRQR